MLSVAEFVKQSLEIHLFFARIMKEHSFFLELGFTPRDSKFTEEADALRKEFDSFLRETVVLSNGVVRPDVLRSGEVITPYTLNAEMASSFFTGVRIPTNITQAEANLSAGGPGAVNPMLERRVFELNQRAIRLLEAIIQFKVRVLSDVLSCKMFTVNYPLLIDHILREARFYLLMVRRLQKREEVDLEKEAYEQEFFWNRIMAEHSKFIRGLLDPTEDELIKTADNFGKEFDMLTAEAKQAMDKAVPISSVTDASLKATRDIRNFKAQGTQGILQCKVKSIIIPLLADHTLREASHFLRLLKIFKGERL